VTERQSDGYVQLGDRSGRPPPAATTTAGSASATRKPDDRRVLECLPHLDGPAGDLCRQAMNAADLGDIASMWRLAGEALGTDPDGQAEPAALYIRSHAENLLNLWDGDGKPSGLPPERYWRGHDLAGKTLLLGHYYEAGYGDVIQGVRRVPALAARPARVVLRTRPDLFRLFSTCAGLAGCADRGAPPPPFDYHAEISALASPAHVK
jgi:hypothetical protein